VLRIMKDGQRPVKLHGWARSKQYTGKTGDMGGWLILPRTRIIFSLATCTYLEVEGSRDEEESGIKHKLFSPSCLPSPAEGLAVKLS
jgi:hypothetical protein